MCSSVVQKKRVVPVAPFLNDDGLSFNHMFGNKRRQRGSKNGRRVDQGYLSSSIPKVQDDRCDNVLKWCRMAKDIENRLSFLLMMNKVLSDSFKVVREEQVLSEKSG